MRGPLRRAALGVMEPVSKVARAHLLERARDASSALERGSALVIAPHPDDDVLGCGATIAAKHAAGEDVRIVYASDGRQSHSREAIELDALVRARRDEATRAAAILGVAAEHLEFFEYPDGGLPDFEHLLTSRIASAIREFRPRHVLCTSIHDFHPDHQAVARATRAAVREAAFDGLLLEYPVWMLRRYPWVHRPPSPAAKAASALLDPLRALAPPRGVRVRTGRHLDTKRAALEAHTSQVRGLDGDEPGWFLPPEFVALFLGEWELFFPVR